MPKVSKNVLIFFYKIVIAIAFKLNRLNKIKYIWNTFLFYKDLSKINSGRILNSQKWL